MKKIISVILAITVVMSMLCMAASANSYKLVASKSFTLGENQAGAFSIPCTKGEKYRIEITQNTAMDCLSKSSTDFSRIAKPKMNDKVKLAFSSNDSRGKNHIYKTWSNFKKNKTNSVDVDISKSGTYTLTIRNNYKVAKGYEMTQKPQFTICVYKK